MGNQPAYEPAPAEDESTTDDPFRRPIEDLQLLARTFHGLKRAGVNTIGELAELTEPELLGFRNLGARAIREITEKLRRFGVDGRAFTPLPMTPMQANRARKSAVGEAVLEVVRGHIGRAVVYRQIRDEVMDRLEFFPEDDEVRECLRLHVRTSDCFVKLSRDAYAWVPNGDVSPSPPAPPHVAEMIKRRWRGLTLDEIGAEFGVTRERVRQLLKKYGGPTAEEVRELRAAEARTAQRDHEAAVAAKIRSALEDREPMTVAEVAEATGIYAGDVARFWPQELSHLRLYTTGNYESRWSDDAILDAIREAALYEFPLTTNAYSDLLSKGQIKGPSMARIGQRFGSWTAACEAAGVVAGQTMRPHYESRWSNDDLLHIARQYCSTQVLRTPHIASMSGGGSLLLTDHRFRPYATGLEPGLK